MRTSRMASWCRCLHGINSLDVEIAKPLHSKHLHVATHILVLEEGQIQKI